MADDLARKFMNADLIDMARENAKTAMQTLIEICVNTEAPPSARIKAAESVLFRAWGKPIEVYMEVPFDYSQLSQSELDLRIARKQQEIADKMRGS